MRSLPLKSLAVTLILGALAAALLRSPVAAQNRGDGDKAMIKRGAYLVNNVARCGDCHTPRDDKGELDMKHHLQGAPIWFKPTKVKVEEWEDNAPDLTSTGILAKWKDEKLVKFLSNGEKADAPMPAYNFTEEDAKAVTAYLRSLPGRKGADKTDKKKKKDDD
jgi:mono/diheme cytochrome c family protein